MIKGWTILVALQFGILTSYSQDITEAEADSLQQVLNKSIPDEDRLDILFRMAEFYIAKPGDNKRDLDDAAECLKTTELINARLKSDDIRGFQAVIASLLAQEKKQEKAGRKMAEKAVSILASSNNKYYLGRAYFNLSNYYRYADRTELVEKIRLVELAVECFARSKYVMAHAHSLEFLADLYEINEQHSKVLEHLDLALKLYKSINYTKLHAVFVLYNRYYFLGGNYKLALDYGLMALRVAETAKDSTLLYCQINNYLGITLVHLKERERAIGYFKIALLMAEKHNDNTSVLMIMNNMVHNYLELKKPQEALELMKGIPRSLLIPATDEGYVLISLCYASIYFELKKYAETGTYCSQIMELIKAHNPRGQVVNDFYYLLIRFYVESRQYALAGIYLKKIDSLSRKLGDPARIKENFYLAFRLDTALGSHRSAIENLLKFQHLNDSLFDETNRRQMQELEVEYETQKNKNEIEFKDQDIVLLHQKNQLQLSGLERADLLRNFIIGGIVAVLIIAGLLYRQSRLRKKNNMVVIHKNEQLQHFLDEKEWLLKEIHHRVKNNLQIVMSLLNSQSAYIDNDAALTAIHDSQHRVHAMSLIHQKLYNSENLSSIDMSYYIRELVSYLSDSFNAGKRVRFELNIEPLETDVSQAIPLGLILNEAITNSIKYAFPDNCNGLISISLSSTSPSHYLLSILDDGVGMPADFKKTGSLGMSLMKGLSEDLDGSFSIENKDGTSIKISFVHDTGIKNRNVLNSSIMSNN
jgi:two-component sensor histidine kinase